MLVDLIEIKISKKEALNNLVKKIPLLSRVVQFNDRIKDINIRYIEYKIFKYKINFVEDGLLKSNDRIISLNTYTGHTKIIDKVPTTVKRYIAKECIEKSKINDLILKNSVKKEIEKNYKKYENENIVLSDIFSVYKPHWTCIYKGKNIFLDI